MGYSSRSRPPMLRTTDKLFPSGLQSAHSTSRHWSRRSAGERRSGQRTDAGPRPTGWLFKERAISPFEEMAISSARPSPESATRPYLGAPRMSPRDFLATPRCRSGLPVGRESGRANFATTESDLVIQGRAGRGGLPQAFAD